MLLLRAVAAWLVQIGVFTGSALILTIARLATPWLRARTTCSQGLVGSLWLGLTLAFEVGFGRFVLRSSWERIVSDYDPRRGGLLPVGLLVLALAPWLTSRLAANPSRRPRGPRASDVDAPGARPSGRGRPPPRAAEAARSVRATGNTVGSYLSVAPALRDCSPSGIVPGTAGGRR